MRPNDKKYEELIQAFHFTLDAFMRPERDGK